MAVDCLNYVLTTKGYRVFVDVGMDNRHGAPSDQMDFALETCRFAIAVVSEEFVHRHHPSKELRYAFERMKWIRRGKAE